MSATATSLIAIPRLRRPRTKPASGHTKKAHTRCELDGLLCDAVVFGVVIVIVKALAAAPGGRMGGLKEAVARLGKPVAAKVTGLEMAPSN
jgi:hypothetical protein